MADKMLQGALRDDVTGALVVKGAGAPLGYLVKSDGNFTPGSGATFVDVTGLASLSVVAVSSVIFVEFSGSAITNDHATLGFSAVRIVRDGSTVIAQSPTYRHCWPDVGGTATTGVEYPIAITGVATGLTPGTTYQFSAQANNPFASGTVTLTFAATRPGALIAR